MDTPALCLLVQRNCVLPSQTPVSATDQTYGRPTLPWARQRLYVAPTFQHFANSCVIEDIFVRLTSNFLAVWSIYQPIPRPPPIKTFLGKVSMASTGLSKWQKRHLEGPFSGCLRTSVRAPGPRFCSAAHAILRPGSKPLTRLPKQFKSNPFKQQKSPENHNDEVIDDVKSGNWVPGNWKAGTPVFPQLCHTLALLERKPRRC